VALKEANRLKQLTKANDVGFQ